MFCRRGALKLCEYIQHIVIIPGILIHVRPIDHFVGGLLQFWNCEGAVQEGALVLSGEAERNETIQQGLNASFGVQGPLFPTWVPVAKHETFVVGDTVGNLLNSVMKAYKSK